MYVLYIVILYSTVYEILYTVVCYMYILYIYSIPHDAAYEAAGPRAPICRRTQTSPAVPPTPLFVRTDFPQDSNIPPRFPAVPPTNPFVCMYLIKSPKESPSVFRKGGVPFLGLRKAALVPKGPPRKHESKRASKQISKQASKQATKHVSK